jgi:hypothetical protein
MNDMELDALLKRHREQRREKASYKLTKDDLIKSIIIAVLSCLMFIEW